MQWSWDEEREMPWVDDASTPKSMLMFIPLLLLLLLRKKIVPFSFTKPTDQDQGGGGLVWWTVHTYKKKYKKPHIWSKFSLISYRFYPFSGEFIWHFWKSSGQQAWQPRKFLVFLCKLLKLGISSHFNYFHVYHHHVKNILLSSSYILHSCKIILMMMMTTTC